MRRFLTFAAATFVLGLLFTATTLAVGLQGSPHNFLTNTDVTGITNVTKQGDELCSACHVPHNATQQSGLLATDYGYTDNALDKKSFLCMSCHDGNVARGGATFNFAGSAAFTGYSHKVGVTIPGTSDYNTNPNLPLNSGKVTCGSCHDPHGTGKMLRKANTNSALCTECHKK